jgi:predicted kinase
VAEGLFTWDDAESSQGNAKELIDLAERYGYNATSIVLKATKNELLKRNAERDYSVPLEEFEALYNGVYNTIDQSELVIDSTSLDLPQTLRAITSELP